jgi:hypothetical protein
MKFKALGVIRHLLTAAGGFAVGKGLVAESDVGTLVAAIVTIVGFVWSVVAPEKKAATG